MNTVGNTLTAYYTALNGNVAGFEVFKITVPEQIAGNFIYMYPESGGDDNNKSSRVENIVIRIDIVTIYENDISQQACEDADTVIQGLIFNSSRGSSLIPATGLQILNVARQNYEYIIERGVKVLYRKVTRYVNRVSQSGS